jgi:hypothetical protein
MLYFNNVPTVTLSPRDGNAGRDERGENGGGERESERGRRKDN